MRTPGAATAPPGGAEQPGLLGTYYASLNTTGPASFTRVDYGINFQWYEYGPQAFRSQPHQQLLRARNFSVVWTGSIVAPITVNGSTCVRSCVRE